MFTPKTQAVAGGVFNTISQTRGKRGLGPHGSVANEVTNHSAFLNKRSPEALLMGYRAAFWSCVALTVAGLCIGVWGLRKIGNVGQKMD